MANFIADYFGEKNVKAALLDYLISNGNDRATYDMMMVLAHNHKDKVIDIVCDYLDKNELHKISM